MSSIENDIMQPVLYIDIDHAHLFNTDVVSCCLNLSCEFNFSSNKFQENKKVEFLDLLLCSQHTK